MIDKAVTVHDHLTNVLVVELRNSPTASWEFCQVPRTVHQISDHCGGICWRVFRNEREDCLQIVDSRLRPGYSESHLLKRDSTSSWEIVPFVRASSRPRRTLSRT